MAPILKLYKATIGTTTYYFLQSPTSYGGTVDTATGITEAEDTDQDQPFTAVAELVRKGKLFRLAVEYGATGVPKKTAKLLVTRDKLTTALDDLLDEPFRGGTITSVRIPQKATFF